MGKLDKASTAADDSERAKKVLFSIMCRVVFVLFLLLGENQEGFVFNQVCFVFLYLFVFVLLL